MPAYAGMTAVMGSARDRILFRQAQNVLRQEEVPPSLPCDMALSNAPVSDEVYFHVPKVIR